MDIVDVVSRRYRAAQGYKFWICTIKNCFSSCRNLVNITIEYVSSIADAYRELLVLLVIVELAQEDEELLLVAAKDGLDLRGLLGVRDKDLEDMERLELDVAALVAEHVHHHLQIRLVRDVARHDVEVGAVKQDLAEQLERLPLRDVVRRQEECGERREELWRSVLSLLSNHMRKGKYAYPVVVLL